MEIYCLDGETGVKEWGYITGDVIRSSPTLGDVDEDGNMEILVGSDDRHVYCLVGNGDPWAIPGPWPCMGGSALHHSNAEDTDGDNLPDILEISLGLNENDIDTDGDGYSDSEEISAGSNPLDDSSTPDSWIIIAIIIGGSILGITTIVIVIKTKIKGKESKVAQKSEPTLDENTDQDVTFTF